MGKVYDADGNELGSVSVSEQQQAALDAGSTVEMLYHTPQLMRSTLGERSGAFSLHKDGDRLVTDTPVSAKEFVRMQAAIKAIRGKS